MFSAVRMTGTGANAQQTPEIPDKLYFRIGEVSRLLDVRPYVLRYWETEFPALAPKKSGTGQRLYRRKDVELLLSIKQLLYDRRYTIEGARRHLKLAGKPEKTERTTRTRPTRQGELFSMPVPGLGEVRKELAAILELLK